MAGLPNPRNALNKTWCGSIVDKMILHKDKPIFLVNNGQYLSYAAIDKYSNMLGNYIKEHYSGKGKIVAIYASRSPNLVITILAIMKAGCAFYIIDPRHPIGRTLDCLRQCNPIGLINLNDKKIIPKEIINELNRMNATFIISIPEDYYMGNIPFPINGGSLALGPTEVAYNDLLYTIFTSGTTGTPKSIKGSIGPVSHFIHWQQSVFGINDSDSVSCLSGLAHDPLLRDIFLPLWAGSRMCIPDGDCFEYPGRLFGWFLDNAITVSHMTPSMANFLLNVPKDYADIKLDKLRYIFLGGEALTWKLVERIQSFAPNAEIVNCYGATETPQVMSYYRILPSFKSSSKSFANSSIHVPIGSGIPECQLLVLDDNANMRSPGSEGEICVRTFHRALEVGSPGNSANSPYMINPYTQNIQDLIYKTGDYGYYLEDGSVMYLGRKDRQVKIRGFRIELSEIEQVLSQDQRIAAYYVDFEETHVVSSITVYVVPADPQLTSGTLVKSILTDHLPFYAIPDNCHIVHKLPLTPNGKVDRDELRRISKAEKLRSDQKIGQDKRALLSTVRSILNDFELGWEDALTETEIDSIRAVEISCAIQNMYDREISISDIYTLNTLSSIDLALRNNLQTEVEMGLNEKDKYALSDVGYIGSGHSGSAGVRKAPPGIKRENNNIRLFPKNENILTAVINRLLQLVARVAPDAWRGKLHRLRGVRIGRKVSIGYDTIIETSYPWLVLIGDNVNIGMRVAIIAHFRGMSNIHKGYTSVKICNNAFIGPGVIILPNVTIGEGSVIAAGSIVSSDIPSYTLARGNPAKSIANCGLALTGNTTYQEFISALKPIK